MRKTLMAAALVCGISIAASAQDFNWKKMELGIWGGYSTVNMSDMNDATKQIAAATGGTATKIENGYFLGGELLWPVMPNLSLGPRVEYLMTNTGKATSALAETTEDHSLLPVMVGGRYVVKNADAQATNFYDKWGLSAGLYAGYGWLFKKLTVKAAGLETSVNATGGGFAGDALVGWEYRFTDNVSLGVDLGYRYAMVPESKTTEDKPALGITKDMVLKDLNGETIKHDFSGLIAGVGVKLKM